MVYHILYGWSFRIFVALRMEALNTGFLGKLTKCIIWTQLKSCLDVRVLVWTHFGWCLFLSARDLVACNFCTALKWFLGGGESGYLQAVKFMNTFVIFNKKHALFSTISDKSFDTQNQCLQLTYHKNKCATDGNELDIYFHVCIVADSFYLSAQFSAHWPTSWLHEQNAVAVGWTSL